MKKAVIKRRKRVVPASQSQAVDATNMSIGSPDSDRLSPPVEHQDQRGSTNPDGSVNLGFRTRDGNRAMLPEPSSTIRNGNSQSQLPNSNLTAYSSNPNLQNHSHEHLESLHDDNRLPPMASYPSPINRRSSLSPGSFLSPSRKRSFSVTEIEQRPNLSDPPPTHPKRLSSIKSILNPGFSESEKQNELDPNLRRGERHSPSQYPGASNLGMGSGGDRGNVRDVSGRDSLSEIERVKAEKKDMLKREAERMREALKAKERELAEMGD
jgi:GATA-binding protein